jgi:hypothetical protein
MKIKNVLKRKNHRLVEGRVSLRHQSKRESLLQGYYVACRCSQAL